MASGGWAILRGGETLFRPADRERTVWDAVLELELSAAGSLSCKVPYTHPLYDAIRAEPVLGEPTWRVERDGEEVFRGRLLSRRCLPMSGYMEITCEGELAMLNDTVVPARAWDMPGWDMLDWLTWYHNRMCSPGHEFRPGRCDFGGRYTASEQTALSTWEALRTLTTSAHGGYIVLRREGTTRYVDWVADPAVPGSQPIALGHNLTSVTDTADGSEMHTALWATGKVLTEGDGSAQSAVTLEGWASDRDGLRVLPNGVVVNVALAASHGVVCDVESFTDAETQEQLWGKAASRVLGYREPGTVTLGAIDMADAGLAVEHFRPGQHVSVDAPGTTGQVLVRAVSYGITDPSDGKVTFGELGDRGVSAPTSTWSAQVSQAVGLANAAVERAAEMTAADVDEICG